MVDEIELEVLIPAVESMYTVNGAPVRRGP